MYNWFRIFNKTEFDNSGLVSRTITPTFVGIGVVNILITNGYKTGITYNDIFLSLELNGENPFEFEGHAIYIDEIFDVFIGLPIED